MGDHFGKEKAKRGNTKYVSIFAWKRIESADEGMVGGKGGKRGGGGGGGGIGGGERPRQSAIG